MDATHAEVDATATSTTTTATAQYWAQADTFAHYSQHGLGAAAIDKQGGKGTRESETATENT